MQTILTGTRIQLLPLALTNKDELYSAAQDESIWTHNSTNALGEQFERWFNNAMQGMSQQEQLTFVVQRLTDNKILGSTRYYDINKKYKRLTIGYTWYIPEVWGTYVNPECKFLLMQYAFETLAMNRIELVTDARNLRSRAAIKKLGAKEEGILRQHMILADGFVRDTVVHSVIRPEWPEVKSNLLLRLQN